MPEGVMFSTKKRDYECLYDDYLKGWKIYCRVNNQDFKYKTFIFNTDKNLTANLLFKSLIADYKNKFKRKIEFPDNYGSVVFSHEKNIAAKKAEIDKMLPSECEI
jgi:hypothetical protein